VPLVEICVGVARHKVAPLVAIPRWPSLLVSGSSDTGSPARSTTISAPFIAKSLYYGRTGYRLKQLAAHQSADVAQIRAKKAKQAVSRHAHDAPCRISSTAMQVLS
jgi:hypothetical protein